MTNDPKDDDDLTSWGVLVGILTPLLDLRADRPRRVDAWIDYFGENGGNR